jgi:Cu+-exporting ATPase
MVDGTRYILGSDRLIIEAGSMVPATTLPEPASLSYLARPDGTVLAAFAFTDALRDGAKDTVKRLRTMGCEVQMLSGDRAAPAQAIGAALGITKITAQASPEQKLDVIRAARAGGAVVAMVGDGVNDAAALAEADIGIAIGTGADVAIEAADFSILRPAPALVAESLALSRKIWAVLRQGLFWAVIYNVIGIPLAAFGFLSPMAAGAAMAASSVCVLANALRLRNWRPK